MKLNIQKFNPLIKTTDQKRDSDGKFTAGSGGLSKLKKFNWVRAAPVIVLISLVGGFLVFRSFAGGKPTPAYQYSAYDKVKCPSFSKDKVSENATWNSCANLSAEALIYRMYHGILGRDPDFALPATANGATGQPAKVSGYAYWTQKLAGDRTRATRVTQLILNSKEATGTVSDEQYVASLYLNVLGREGDKSGKAYWLGQLSTKKKTRQDALAYFAAQAKPVKTVTQAATDMGYPTTKKFVENLYAGFLGRQPDAKGLASWTKQLDTKKYERNQVAAIFAQSSESAKFMAPKFAEFIKAAPQVAIKTTASDQQKFRDAQARLYAADTNNKWKIVVTNFKSSNTDLSNAKAIAAKSKLARSDYENIGIRQRSSQDKYNKAAAQAKAARVSFKKADAVLKDARAVEAYSPDLGTASTETWRNKAAVYTVDSENKTSAIKSNITAIANQYKIAVNKYNNQCNSGGQDYNGSAPGCGQPQPAPVNSGGGDTPDPVDRTPPPGGGDCSTLSGSYRYHSSNRHVTYTISYKKKSDGKGACIIDPSTKRAAGGSVCDGGYIPNGTASSPSCKVNPANAGAAQRQCVKDGGRWGNGKCTYNSPVRCDSNDVVRAGKCVSNYVYARKADCEYNWTPKHAPHGNRSKYYCQYKYDSGKKHAPPARYFECYNSAQYARITFGNYAACRRK